MRTTMLLNFSPSKGISTVIESLRRCLLTLVLVCLVGPTVLTAHTPDGETNGVRNWLIDGVTYKASFMLFRDNLVYLETVSNDVIKVPLHRFSERDQISLRRKFETIQRLNNRRALQEEAAVDHSVIITIAWCSLFVCLSALVFSLLFLKKKSLLKLFLAAPIIILLTAINAFNTPSKLKLVSVTNPKTIDSAFSKFRPNVNTYWDNTYFYVESKGIPTTHTMMVGISNHGWQQQVPIPQCFTGSNAWPIPLNPTIANTPVPVNNQHFLKGAIAIAANGVPIFNVYTNAGVDSYTDGQLDTYGGHCGRADDYHYHIAPLHLYATNPATLPVAYALDGFAVYGSKEPDGSNMTGLDANHGHFGTNGVYHYHGTTTAPYMIGNMVGKVTEDNDLQIIPQAQTTPIRPALTPLSGASITACNPVGNNGYQLTYLLNGLTYTVSFNWTASGVYTYSFISTTGKSVETYTGFAPCSVPTNMNDIETTISSGLIYPNPAKKSFQIAATSPIFNEVTKALVYDLEGRLQMSAFPDADKLVNIESLSKGGYIVYLISPYRVFKTRLIVTDWAKAL